MLLLRSRLMGCALFVALLSCCLAPARAVTPESPEVIEVIEKGLKFLETAKHDRVGGKALAAIAFMKNGRPKTHPKVKEALAAVLGHKFGNHVEADNYDLALMIIFLCEYEDPAHRPLVQRMLNELYKRQMPFGAWTYDMYNTGDISQTQYAVLAMWMAQTHGFDVPIERIGAVLNFLLRVQDKGGGWGYQASDPGPGKPRIEQSPLTMSLGSAALGSVYVLCDLVIPPGDPFSRPADVKEKSKLPAAVQEVIDKSAAVASMRRRSIGNVNTQQIQAAMKDGNAFLQKAFSLEETEWKYYACYAYERYFSFREVIEQTRNPEPKWYNDMYADFKKHQKADGSWDGGDGPVANTAFAVLVLCRSTAKVINRAVALGEGIMLGGMGLPPDTKNLSEVNGKLVETKVTGDVDNLLKMLDQNSPLVEQLVSQDQVIKLDGDITKRAGQIRQLRDLVTNGAPDARIVAVRSLAKARNYDQIPILLFALGDKDVRVVREADRGLRFVSRKFDGVMNTSTLEDPGMVNTLRAAWRDWYLSIKPDAELLD